MEHRSLAEIRNEAYIVPFAPTSKEAARTTRRQRLERFATLLKRHEGSIKPLSRIEYLPESERLLLREDNSPLTIAFLDPVLREDGLASDRLGDAMEFFGLTSAEVHHLLCDCHYSGTTTGPMIAARAQSLARRVSLAEACGRVWSRLRSWAAA